MPNRSRNRPYFPSTAAKCSRASRSSSRNKTRRGCGPSPPKAYYFATVPDNCARYFSERTAAIPPNKFPRANIFGLNETRRETPPWLAASSYTVDIKVVSGPATIPVVTSVPRRGNKNFGIVASEVNSNQRTIGVSRLIEPLDRESFPTREFAARSAVRISRQRHGRRRFYVEASLIKVERPLRRAVGPRARYIYGKVPVIFAVRHSSVNPKAFTGAGGDS